MTMITIDFLKHHDSCWMRSDEKARRAKEILGDGLPLVDVLKLDEVSNEHKLWLVTCADEKGHLCGLPYKKRCEWMSMLVKRALTVGKVTDPRSLAVCEILNRLSRGEEIRKDELAAACVAAWAAARDAACVAACVAAWDAARDAARAAARDAARAAARDAARDAAWAAEEDRQIKDAIEILSR